MVQSGRFQGVERSGTEVENSCEDGQANEHETLRVNKGTGYSERPGKVMKQL